MKGTIRFFFFVVVVDYQGFFVVCVPLQPVMERIGEGRVQV